MVSVHLASRITQLSTLNNCVREYFTYILLIYASNVVVRILHHFIIVLHWLFRFRVREFSLACSEYVNSAETAAEYANCDRSAPQRTGPPHRPLIPRDSPFTILPPNQYSTPSKGTFSSLTHTVASLVRLDKKYAEIFRWSSGGRRILWKSSLV
jgi:hypothetical protein